MSCATPILPSGPLRHVPEMTGHVAEIAGHDPETAGHVGPKYAASEAEGFGLPLVEAAQFGTPLFVRDLPVFREIAGDNATYFRERTGVELAPRLAAWLNQIDESSAPNSSNMARLTWAESAQQLRTLLIELDRTQA
ncbi:glycosyltransferase, partial [Burkholderia sp. AU45251]|uniref:glycosyltransferase n=1 Tax=Burkholderia sp. AU45251 TaxID=3059204 RepID=UPI0026567EBC|nr:hypothetical protein [Burkholderia sp. AU45251]